MNHMINIKLFYVLFGWNRYIYIYIYVRSCDIQAHLGLGLQPDNVAHTVPKPSLRSPLSPLNKRSSLVHTTHAFWVISGKLLPEKGSHCSVVLSLGCSTVPRKYWRPAYPLRWEAVPMPLLPLLPKHPLWSNRIGPPTH